MKKDKKFCEWHGPHSSNISLEIMAVCQNAYFNKTTVVLHSDIREQIA